MADIHIHRAHSLGLAKARTMAWQWAEAVEQKFAMECTVIEGKTRDVVEFTRSGVKGQLVVEADAFDLTARLGLLVGAFAGKIEAEVEAQLDALLAAPAKSTAKTPAKTPTKTAAKRAPPRPRG